MENAKRIIARIIVIGVVVGLLIFAGYFIVEKTIAIYHATNILTVIAFNVIVSHAVLLCFGIAKAINWAIDNF